MKRFLSMMLVMALMAGMFAFGAMTVSAAGNPLEVTLDFKDEIIEIKVDPDVYFNGDVLYTLVKDPAKYADKPDKAKWFPLIGFDADDSITMDISKFIPKKADKSFFIYFVVKPELISYGSAGVPAGDISNDQKIELVGREAGKDTIKKANEGIYFDFADYKLKNGATAAIEYRVGLGSWAGLAAASEVDLMFDAFPAGAVGVARVPASATAFASTEVKFKIPAQPKAPKIDKIKFEDGILKNVSDKLEVLIDDDPDKFYLEDSWLTLKKNMTLAEFRTGVGLGATATKMSLFVIRVAGTNKKLPSVTAVVKDFAVPVPTP